MRSPIPDRLIEMRCEHCGEWFHFAIMECHACGCEGVHAWRHRPPNEALELLICECCGDTYRDGEAASMPRIARG